MDDETNKAVANAVKSVADAFSIPNEVKKAGLLPIVDRMAETFKNKRNIKKFDLDNQNILIQEYQKYLQKRTQQFLSDNPNVSFNEANEFLLRKQIDDSKYSINDEYMRDRFARLISNTAIDDTNVITPNFSSVLSNLNSNTAKILINLTNLDLNPLAYFGVSRVAIFRYLEPIPNRKGYFKKITVKSNGEINQLVSLGLVEIIDNYQIHITNSNENLYLEITDLANDYGFTESDLNSYAAINLTDFGRNFVNKVY